MTRSPLPPITPVLPRPAVATSGDRPEPARRRPGASGFLASLLAAAMLFGAVAAPPARATTELLRHGPVAALGASPGDDTNADDRTLATGLAGWRFVYDDFAWTRNLLDGIGTNLDFLIEPLFGVLGDDDTTSVELSVVPLLRLEPAGAETWFPYFEGGIGIIYSDLRGFDLGSRILFSDNVGIGIAMRRPDGSRIAVGYRYRHISHAGIWADANNGLDSHFLTLSWERP